MENTSSDDKQYEFKNESISSISTVVHIKTAKEKGWEFVGAMWDGETEFGITATFRRLIRR